MRKISVIEIIDSPNAILHNFGMNLFQALDPLVSKNEKIQLTFSGIHNVTSGFMNASFGNLYLKYGDKLDSFIDIKDFDNSDWKAKLSDSKLLALEPQKAKILNDALVDLFD